MPKAYEKHPLFQPSAKRMLQGSAAMTVNNAIKRGAKPADWAIKAAGIKKPAKKK